MAIKRLPPIEELRKALRLDPQTGRIFCRDTGEDALCRRHSAGYLCGNVMGQTVLAHRVAFALHYGRDSDFVIDHRNGDRTDNRPDNLREATKAQNAHNSYNPKGASRFVGVSPYPGSSFWQAYITTNGRRKVLGSYPTEEAAARAFDRAARAVRGEFATLNFPEDADTALAMCEAHTLVDASGRPRRSFGKGYVYRPCSRHAVGDGLCRRHLTLESKGVDVFRAIPSAPEPVRCSATIYRDAHGRARKVSDPRRGLTPYPCKGRANESGLCAAHRKQ